jgi:hypothetical protein
VAGHGEIGAPEVGDDYDRWAPPVGECVREGRERWVGGLSWAERVWWADWREEKKGEEESGPWAGWGKERGLGLVFFFLFSNPFKQFFSKPFFKSNLLHKFLHTFHKPFSQLF